MTRVDSGASSAVLRGGLLDIAVSGASGAPQGSAQ